MSDVLEAIILGVVQGLTEFLPVSSSGHLEIFKYIFDYQGSGEQSLLLTVTLHGATALSTIVVFWRDIRDILRDLLRFEWNDGTRLSAFIVLSMIPAGVVGLLFEDVLESLFEGRVLFVALMLVVTGVLLIVADSIMNGDRDVRTGNALVVGLAQAIAILPGISRSGATISAGLLMKMDRDKVARFSFLMVLPLIFGKIMKDLLTGDYQESQIELMPLVAGTVSAFIVGFAACRWMLTIVKRAQLKYFSFYCFAVALIVFIHLALQ